MKQAPLRLLLAAFAATILTGCQSVMELGTEIGVSSGAITEEEAASIRRGAGALGKAVERITPEQEYYLGRAVAASIMSGYAPYENEAANRYITKVGELLALASDKPETFAGYHFQILQSDEVNAFAAPGGFIMVTLGMLRCCRSEDALAAVLAHEIGHVQGQHGLRAIRQSRLASALTVIAAESARQLGDQDMRELAAAYEGSIQDITQTLVNNGYSRALERDADAAAVTILRRVGYDPGALVDMLTQMEGRVRRGGPGFGKTHPEPSARIAEIRRWIGAPRNVATTPDRQRRFVAALGGSGIVAAD